MTTQDKQTFAEKLRQRTTEAINAAPSSKMTDVEYDRLLDSIQSQALAAADKGVSHVIVRVDNMDRDLEKDKTTRVAKGQNEKLMAAIVNDLKLNVKYCNNLGCGYCNMADCEKYAHYGYHIWWGEKKK